MGELTQQELEQRLLDAANALRGPVDPTDFKAYIFPPLFFKWISDTWDWEHAEAVAEWGDDLNDDIEADYHRFVLPDGAHWPDLQKHVDNVGVELQKVFDAVQQANPEKLAGIFGDVAWGNKERLPEASLHGLIEAFNRLNLNPEAVSSDMLGNAYEYLLKYFADESGKKAGEFFTPREVVHLIGKILDPQPGDTVYDPACGSGGMLVEAINDVKESGGDPTTLRLYGQEVNLTTAAMSRMNLYFHGIEDFEIVRGDTLRNPKFTTARGLATFDCVIANPPFSLKKWGADTWKNDAWGRPIWGVPPDSYGDYAWVQHMVRSMHPKDGRVGVVMPHGVLFRSGKEGDIRKEMVESGKLDAVIGLPANLFYSTSIQASILVFRAEEREGRSEVVQFIDASQRFIKDMSQNRMDDTAVEDIVTAYRTGDDPDGDDGLHTRLVPVEEIADNGYDLNIGRYVGGTEADEIDVEDALFDAFTAYADLAETHDTMLLKLEAAGYLTVEEDE